MCRFVFVFLTIHTTEKMNNITERECESLSDNFFSLHLDLGILNTMLRTVVECDQARQSRDLFVTETFGLHSLLIVVFPIFHLDSRNIIKSF